MMAKRSSRFEDRFNLKRFLRNYPIVVVIAIAFGVAALFAFGVTQKNIFWRHAEKEITKRDVRSRGPAPRAAKTAATSQIPVPIVRAPAPPRAKLALRTPLEEGALVAERMARPKPQPGALRKPRIVFVIDDIGYNKLYEALLFSFDRPVTLSILPQVPYSKYFAQEGKRRGFETILHQPLEPEDEAEDPGAGMITINMSVSQVRNTLEKNLETVPGVTGMSNHMGSRATRDRGIMYLVAKEVKRRQLFFLDSVTHLDSIAYDVAFALGVPTVKRDVFLDNEDDFAYVTERIAEVAHVAEQSGHAIAIGHFRENTLRAIKKAIPELEASGFEISTLKDLM